MMFRQLLCTLSCLLIAIGIAVPVQAYQYGSSYTLMNLGGFDNSYEYANSSYKDQYLNGVVDYREIGVYSAGFAYAYEQYKHYKKDHAYFHRDVLSGWAGGFTDKAFAATAAKKRYREGGSVAVDKNGSGHGAEPGAIANSYASANQFNANQDVALAIKMDYYLGGKAGGFSRGGSAAGSLATIAKRDGLSRSYDNADKLNASESLGAGDDFISPADTVRYANEGQSEYGAMPVPEPTTMMLFGAGLLGIAGFGRRRLAKK